MFVLCALIYLNSDGLPSARGERHSKFEKKKLVSEALAAAGDNCMKVAE